MTGDDDNPGVCEQDRRSLAQMTLEERCRLSHRDARRAMQRRGLPAPTYEDYAARWLALHESEVDA